LNHQAFFENVSSGFGDETILSVTKPFSAFGAGIWKRRMVIKLNNNNGGRGSLPQRQGLSWLRPVEAQLNRSLPGRRSCFFVSA
jgi:hypothetical protein